MGKEQLVGGAEELDSVLPKVEQKKIEVDESVALKDNFQELNKKKRIAVKGSEKKIQRKPNWVDNFNNFSEEKKQSRSNSARGTVHLKSLREELNQKNLKNRKA